MSDIPQNRIFAFLTKGPVQPFRYHYILGQLWAPIDGAAESRL
jgi:hypothetical protein